MPNGSCSWNVILAKSAMPRSSLGATVDKILTSSKNMSRPFFNILMLSSYALFSISASSVCGDGCVMVLTISLLRFVSPMPADLAITSCTVLFKNVPSFSSRSFSPLNVKSVLYEAKKCKWLSSIPTLRLRDSVSVAPELLAPSC